MPLIYLWEHFFLIKKIKNLNFEIHYTCHLHELGSHGPHHLHFKRRIHGSHFFFINWAHNPRHHQRQYTGWAQVMSQNSLPMLLFSYSRKAASPTKAHIYTKWRQSPRYVISSLAYDPSSWVALGKLWELWFEGPRGMFSKTPTL